MLPPHIIHACRKQLDINQHSYNQGVWNVLVEALRQPWHPYTQRVWNILLKALPESLALIYTTSLNCFGGSFTEAPDTHTFKESGMIGWKSHLSFSLPRSCKPSKACQELASSQGFLKTMPIGLLWSDCHICHVIPLMPFWGSPCSVY